MLSNLPCPTTIAVIDGHPIASKDLVEESEPIRIVLGNLAFVISFSTISRLEHVTALDLLI